MTGSKGTRAESA